ncbi:MAG: hypothetical protein AB7G88_00220 [Thermomicrobiales bacterium]
MIGAWQWLWDAQNPDGPVTNGLFSEDGTYLDYDLDFKWINLGLWTPTSDRAADLVVIGQQVMLPESLLDLAAPLPESVIVPEMNRSRQSVEVDDSGNLMTNHTQFVGADGQDLSDYYSHQIIGVRLILEPEAFAAARS